MPCSGSPEEGSHQRMTPTTAGSSAEPTEPELDPAMEYRVQGQWT